MAMTRGVNYTRFKAIAYRCAVYSVALFLLAVAQVTFFAKLDILGATPDLLLGAVTIICMREDVKVSSICGAIAGLFYCSLGCVGYPLYLPFSFICAYLLRVLAVRSFGRNYPSFLALCVTAFFAKAVFNFAEVIITSSSFALFATLTKIVLPEFIASMLFCSVSYAIINPISKIINKSNHRKEHVANER